MIYVDFFVFFLVDDRQGFEFKPYFMIFSAWTHASSRAGGIYIPGKIT